MTATVQRTRSISSETRRTLIAGLVVVAFTVFVCVESWAGSPITFNSILFWLIVGITYGSVYAVAATGLVVTYTTSGIFNFAQGAIGMFLAYIFWQLQVGWGIQTFVALLLTVFVAAPIMGALIERVLMRAIADAPLVAQIVTTIGLMLALMGLAGLIWDPQETRHINRFFGTSGFNIGDTLMPWSRFITIVVGLGLALGLKILLSRTRLGVAMRAVVDNRELAGLNGIKPGRVSMFSWALGSSMAAVAGIFLAEELATLDVQTLTLLILSAFAAAIIGRLKSLPLTFMGGLLIGLVFEFQQNFLSWTGRWTTAPLAIPQIMLFLALLFLPQARIEGKKLVRQVAPRIPKIRTAALGHGHPLRGRGRPRARVRAHRHPHAHPRVVDHAHHGVARPAHRLVEADLAGADHVRGRRRVRVPAVGAQSRHHRWPGDRLAVRDPVRGGDGPPGAAIARPLPRARDHGLRADGGDPVLPATRDPRVRRQADPLAQHPRLRLQQAVHVPRHRLRPGRRHDALHRRRAGRRRCARRLAAQERVRPPAHRAGRQPGRVARPSA